MFNRHKFIELIGVGAGVIELNTVACSGWKKIVQPDIPGCEQAPEDIDVSKEWLPVSDRKIRVGIAGYGISKFGALFGFQDHPNVEAEAVNVIKALHSS